MAEKIKARLQTPADAVTGLRNEVDVITSTTAVVVSDTKTLDKLLGELGFGSVLAVEKPAFECMWSHIKSEETLPSV